MEYLKANWEYLRYVLRHKWLVLQEGRKLNVPLWTLLIHDWQKFSPAEWSAYVGRFYYHGNSEDVLRERFAAAWAHHLEHGPHHHEHWVVDGVALPMPLMYIKEMIADWNAMARAQGKSNAKTWYFKNQRRMNLHPETKLIINNLLDVSPEENMIR